MRPDRVIVPAPAFNHYLSLPERVKNLPVQHFVSEAGIKTLDVTVLSSASRRDVRRLRTDRLDPCLSGYGDELGFIIRRLAN